MGDSYEVRAGSANAPAFLTCEHASQDLPEGYAWPEGDRRLIDTHWAVDLGARDLTLELAEAIDAPAVLARYSRLLIDLNRPEVSDTLFRATADGEPVHLNHDLSDDERALRLSRYHTPFHDTVDRELRATRCPMVLAIHTFTDRYEGTPRQVEIGVLFDTEEALGNAWVTELRALGYDARANEPWSGKAGLIYVASRHGDRHGRRAMELEVRQDLAMDPAFRKKLVPQLATLISRPL